MPDMGTVRVIRAGPFLATIRVVHTVPTNTNRPGVCRACLSMRPSEQTGNRVFSVSTFKGRFFPPRQHRPLPGLERRSGDRPGHQRRLPARAGCHRPCGAARFKTGPNAVARLQSPRPWCVADPRSSARPDLRLFCPASVRAIRVNFSLTPRTPLTFFPCLSDKKTADAWPAAFRAKLVSKTFFLCSSARPARHGPAVPLCNIIAAPGGTVGRGVPAVAGFSRQPLMRPY